MELTAAELWKIQSDIKYRHIHFYPGDKVMLFCKRSDGYPRYLSVGDIGVVKSVELNHIIVDFSAIYGHWISPGQIPVIKLPKKLFVERVYLRELKLRQLLG